MFDIGFGEFLVIAVIGLFLFGPDRLPKAVGDAARMLRQLREMSARARSEISEAVGPELSGLDISSLNPRKIVTSALFDEPTTTSQSASATVRMNAPLAAGELPPWDSDAT